MRVHLGDLIEQHSEWLCSSATLPARSRSPATFPGTLSCGPPPDAPRASRAVVFPWTSCVDVKPAAGLLRDREQGGGERGTGGEHQLEFRRSTSRRARSLLQGTLVPNVFARGRRSAAAPTWRPIPWRRLPRPGARKPVVPAQWFTQRTYPSASREEVLSSSCRGRVDGKILEAGIHRFERTSSPSPLQRRHRDAEGVQHL